jgi:hypothetical protein
VTFFAQFMPVCRPFSDPQLVAIHKVTEPPLLPALAVNTLPRATARDSIASAETSALREYTFM